MISRDEYDLLMAKALSETAFQEQIVQLARTLGYLCYHTLDSRGSERGFYDLTLQKAPRLILLELKRQTGKDAVLSREQVLWLDDAARTRDSGNPGLEVYGAVRPMDSGAVQVMLAEGVGAPGALHQWCLDPACARCTGERGQAKVTLRGVRRRWRR